MRRHRARGTAAAALIAVLALAGPVSASGDPLRGDQWGHDLIRVDVAWTVGRGAGAVVAVVDTGVALDHPDLVDRFVRDGDGQVVGLDLVDDDGDPTDGHGHGTLVAGIIAATAGNDEGIAGIAPEARLLPIRVLDGSGAGDGDDVDAAIRWAVDRGADVINVSLEAVRDAGAPGDAPAVPTAAVRYAWDNDVVVVVAAGNSAGSATSYPADSPIVIVGAVDRDDRPASFSEVDRDDVLLAPGIEIVSTWCRRSASGCDPGRTPYGIAEGTSFAAPHVSGVAALLAAEGLSAPRIVDRLWTTAVDLGPEGADRDHGAGRLDAAAAVGARPANDRTAAAAATARSDAAGQADLPAAAGLTDGEEPPAAGPDDDGPDPDPTALEDAPDSEPATDAADPAGGLGEGPSAAPVPGPRDGLLVRLLASGLLLVTMATWSAAARAADRAADRAAGGG